MENKKHKKAFSFYRSYFDILNMLNDKQYVEFSKAINNVLFFEIHIDDIKFKDATLGILWASIRHSLIQSIDGYINKKNITYNQALVDNIQRGFKGASKGLQRGFKQEEEKEEVEEQVEEQVQEKEKGQYVNVFSAWQSILNHKRSKLDVKRKRKIKAALELGYSVDELIEAIKGCSMSSFHMGENKDGVKYDSIDLIFRDADKIDNFISIYKQGGTKKKGIIRDNFAEQDYDKEF